jgi:hypothetical protein
MPNVKRRRCRAFETEQFENAHGLRKADLDVVVDRADSGHLGKLAQVSSTTFPSAIVGDDVERLRGKARIGIRSSRHAQDFDRTTIEPNAEHVVRIGVRLPDAQPRIDAADGNRHRASPIALYVCCFTVEVGGRLRRRRCWLRCGR